MMLYVFVVAGAAGALGLLARWGRRVLREIAELESLSQRELGTLAAVVPLWEHTRPPHHRPIEQPRSSGCDPISRSSA